MSGKRAPKPMPEPADFTSHQAAAYLGISFRKFQYLDAANRFSRIEHGPRLVRYPKAALDLYRASRLRGGPGEQLMTDGRCSQEWQKVLPLILGGFPRA